METVRLLDHTAIDVLVSMNVEERSVYTRLASSRVNRPQDMIKENCHINWSYHREGKMLAIRYD